MWPLLMPAFSMQDSRNAEGKESQGGRVRNLSDDGHFVILVAWV